MKKILFATIIALLCVGSTNAQASLPYKPLEGFKADTVAFVEYNFTRRADYYKDKDFSEFLADLEIHPVASGQGYSVGEDDSFDFTSIRLYLNKQGKKSLFIQVYWADHAPMPSNLKNLFKKYGMHTWVLRYGAVLGSYKIERISTNETFNKRVK